MTVIHVHVHVRADAIDAFREATVVNAAHSLREPGVARFDVIQQHDDPSRFVLVEAYKSAEAITAHKETTHYTVWRNAVASLLEEPRSSTKYTNVFPEDDVYGMRPGPERP